MSSILCCQAVATLSDTGLPGRIGAGLTQRGLRRTRLCGTTKLYPEDDFEWTGDPMARRELLGVYLAYISHGSSVSASALISSGQPSRTDTVASSSCPRTRSLNMLFKKSLVLAFAALSAAHPGHEEQERRAVINTREYRAKTARALENCSAKLQARGDFQRGIERRVAEVAKQRIARRIPVQSTYIPTPTSAAAGY